jgi:CheY-like chemotaxis protein
MHHRKIFVVDDEPTIAATVAELLSCGGFSVAAATNSLDALSRISGAVNDYDVLVTDNHMPHLTGGQLIQRLRAAGFTGKIVMYSGDVLPDEEAIFKAMGADVILHKPLDMNALVPTIQRLCGE